MVSVVLSSKRYSENEGRIFMRQLLDRIEQIPGVERVGVTSILHLNKLSTESMVINVDGIEPPPERQGYTVDKAYVDPGFFDAVGIPILRGRNFSDTDRTDSQQVAIVNEALVEKFWPREVAIGRTIRLENGSDLIVVGIARDTKVRDLSESPLPFIYLPYSQSYSAFMEIIARTGVEPERTARDMVATARELDPELVLWAPRTVDEHLGFVLLPFRLSAWILSAFAVLAMALASVGLYGIVSYAVSRRSREVGIRMSLGAEPRRVVREIVREGMGLAVVGAAIGLVLALAGAQILRSLLFGVGPLDPITFGMVP